MSDARQRHLQRRATDSPADLAAYEAELIRGGHPDRPALYRRLLAVMRERLRQQHQTAYRSFREWMRIVHDEVAVHVDEAMDAAGFNPILTDPPWPAVLFGDVAEEMFARGLEERGIPLSLDADVDVLTWGPPPPELFGLPPAENDTPPTTE